MAFVTICLPVFNAARYLREAMDGILAQTYSDWHLIISDNASTDGSWEIASSFRDPRISLFRHATNIGGGPNFQSVMSRVTTPLFCFHAGDDYFLPQHLERRVRLINAQPSVSFAHGAMNVIDADGAFLGIYREPLAELEPRESLAPRFLQSNPVNVAGAVIRTEAVRKMGFALDLRYPLLFDWHLFMTLTLQSTGTAYDELPTAAYRLHAQSVARQTEGTGRWVLEEKGLQLDSLREHRRLWSEFMDPDAAARAVTEPLWRTSMFHLLRRDVPSARALWRLFRTHHSPLHLAAAVPRSALRSARRMWRSRA